MKIGVCAKFQHLLRAQEGFTLPELMIVIGIVGVLLAIALPKYRRIVANTRMAEAKIALGVIYTVEKSFEAESSTFTSCLNLIGYKPNPGGKQYYTVGYPDQHASDHNHTLWNGDGSVNAAGDCPVGAGTTYFMNNVGDPFERYPDPAGGWLSQDEFHAWAQAFLISGDQRPDEWMISHDKELIHMRFGH